MLLSITRLESLCWKVMVMSVVVSLLVLPLLAADTSSGSGSGSGGRRWKREEDTELLESTTGDGLPPIEPVPGPSLGEILGLVALVITILYIIGMSWKVIKIFKGEYVPTEPVYLKYK